MQGKILTPGSLGGAPIPAAQSAAGPSGSCVGGMRDHPQGGSRVSFTPEDTTVDAWLQWFATEKQAACRAYLCTRYQLNALDAEALINTALLQVCRHWSTLQDPLAYVWQTLKHAVGK